MRQIVYDLNEYGTLRALTAAPDSPTIARAVSVLADLAQGRPVERTDPDALALFTVGAWRIGGWDRPSVAGAKGQP